MIEQEKIIKMIDGLHEALMISTQAKFQDMADKIRLSCNDMKSLVSKAFEVADESPESE